MRMTRGMACNCKLCYEPSHIDVIVFLARSFLERRRQTPVPTERDRERERERERMQHIVHILIIFCLTLESYSSSRCNVRATTSETRSFAADFAQARSKFILIFMP